MGSEAMAEDWMEPYAGFEYQPRAMTVEAAEQNRLNALCDIGPEVFGDDIEPSGFISLAIQEGVRNRIHANGTVNMAQRIAMHRPMRLGEALTVRGRILDVQEVPRGRVATSETWYEGADGARALTSGRVSLRPDAAKGDARGAGEKPAVIVADVSGLRRVAGYTLTPAAVSAYSGPHNPIHFDPEAARRGGFRAPIIGGGHGVRFLTAEIWKRGRPQVLEMDINFRRPIFWDDAIEVMVQEAGGAWAAMCLVKDGKVCTEARIRELA
jgi:acyl dehydratase